MTKRINEIAVKLEQDVEDTAALFLSLNPLQRSIPVYTDGAQWTVRQMLAHFLTIERSMHAIFTNMLEGGQGDDGSFDLERFNARQPAKYDDVPFEDLLEQYQEVRVKTIDIVRSMTEEDLDRTGYHPFLGEGTLEQFVRWAYEHTALHEQDIRQELGL